MVLVVPRFLPNSLPTSLLALLLVALPAAWAALPADGAAAGAEDPACEPTYVEGLGPTCRTPDGLYEIRGRDGALVSYTHGPDRAPEGDLAAQMSGRTPPSFWTPRMPHCVDGTMGEYYAKVLYVRAFDDGPTWARTDEFVRNLVLQGNGIVDLSAQVSRTESFHNEKGGNHADLVVQCAQGQVWVERVVLWQPKSLLDMQTIVQELQALGYSSPRVHYWIYYDDTEGCPGCLGMAGFFPDPSKAVTNLNNGNAGAMYAVTFEVDEPRTMLHELTHTMGGVQLNATHSDGGPHVFDGSDILSGAGAATTFCTFMEYDCGRDDYFHVDPPQGSYLDDNWNLADQMHRYIRMNGSVVDFLQCPDAGFVGVPIACTMAGGNLEAASVRLTIDWGDLSSIVANARVKQPHVATHTYAAEGLYRIHVRAEDVGGAPQPSGWVPFDVRVHDTVNELADCPDGPDCPVDIEVG